MIINADHVSLGCHRSESRTTIRIIDLPNQFCGIVVQVPVDPPRVAPADCLKNLIAAEQTPERLSWGLYNDNFTHVVYSEPQMQSYIPHSDNSTIIVQAQKGVGKTKALIELIRNKYLGYIIS